MSIRTLVPLALLVLLAPSLASAGTDMPLSSLLSPSMLANSPFPPQGDLATVLEAVRVTDFSSHGAPDAHLEVEVEFTGEIDLTVPALAGFGLIVGHDDAAGKGVGESGATEENGLRVRFDYGDSPQRLTLSSTRPDEVVGILRLPSMLLAEGGGPAGIAIKAGAGSPLVADTDGHLLLPGLELGRTEVGTTGIVLSATGVVVDLDPAHSPPTVADGDGSFQGVLLGKVTVDLPAELGGVQVTATDFVIGPEGITGKIEAELANVDFEVGGIGTKLTSLCVQITDNSAELCGAGGTMELPADYFACADDPDTTLPVELDYTGGTYTGTVELAKLPEKCRKIRFGGVEGSYLDLTGAPTPTYDCLDRVMGSPVTPAAFLRVEVTPEPFKISLAGFAEAAGTTPVPIGVLRLDEQLLRPRTDAGGIILPSSLVIGPSGVCLGCQQGGGLHLPLMEVGGSGVAVCADDIAIDLDESLDAWESGSEPEGTSSNGDWKGFYAASLKVRLPFTVRGATEEAEFAAAGLAIGNGGVTGTFVATNALPSVEFAGFEVLLSTVSVGFVHNTPTSVGVAGNLWAPFLDRELSLGFSLDGQGGWLASIATADGLPIDASRKLGAFELRMLLLRAKVGCEAGDCFVQMDATVGLASSAFSTGDISLEALRIAPDGKVVTQGGWYTFAEPKRIGIGGFSYELSRLGFGSRDDGRSWAALGGVFQLQDVLPVDVEIHDVAVSWQPGTREAPTFADPRLEISAIKLAMEVQDVLALEGALLWCSSGTPGCRGGDADLGSQWFEGQVDVALVSPPMALGGRVLVGKNHQPGQEWTFWYAQIDAQLPAGIPLGSGVSLFGGSGGFGKNVALEVSNEFPRQLNTANPVHPQRGSFVFTMGCVLGSTFDNGFTVNADTTLFVQVPGPVVALLGQGWVLTERSQRKLPPLITANIIFDGLRREFVIGLTARYQTRESVGDIVDLGGSFEVLLGAENWHLFLGTRAQPVGGAVFKDFVPLRVESYVMFGSDVPFEGGPRHAFVVGANLRLEDKGSALGGAVGYACALHAGGELALQMHPKHVLIQVGLGGMVEVSVGPVRAGLSLEAALHGQLPTPYEVGASAELAVETPWPLPDVNFNVSFNWTKPSSPPKFPPSLKEIVFASEATGRTVTAFDAQSMAVCPPTIANVPFDSIAQVTFSRRMDCRDASSVRPCPESTGSDDFFRDTVGSCTASRLFTGWTVSPEGGSPALSVEGGWGGALGAPETSAAAERRYETFTFRPVRYAFESCPGGSSNGSAPDDCHPVTKIPGTCRVAPEIRACGEYAGCGGVVHTLRHSVGDDDGFHPGDEADRTGPGPGWPGCPFGDEGTPLDGPQSDGCRTWQHDYALPPGACVRGARLTIKWALTADRQCRSCLSLPGSPSRPTEAISFASPLLGRLDFGSCHDAFTGAMYGDCERLRQGGLTTLHLAAFPGVLERLDGTPLTVSLTDDTIVDFAALEIDYTLPSLPSGGRLGNRYLAPEGRLTFEQGGELAPLGRCADPGILGLGACGPSLADRTGCEDPAGPKPAKPCCCAATLHPIVCEDGREGGRIVSGYGVDDEGRLLSVEAGGATQVVGRCDALEAPPVAACPFRDPALCRQLPASAPVFCHLSDGTAVAPPPEQLTTSVECGPGPGGGATPGAPLCPKLKYRFRLDTQTRTANSPTGSCAAGNTSQTCEITYTVEPPPPSLEPYVRWTSPPPSARAVYRRDDVVLQFSSAALCELFGCCAGMHPLEVELRKADMRKAADRVSGSLLRQGCNAVADNVTARLGQPDDFLVFDPADDLEPEARYVFTLPGPPGAKQPPYLERSFITSRFATFADALAGAQAYAAGNRIYLQTAEALDWLHVSASIGGLRIDGRRLSEDGDFVHVFLLDQPGDPNLSVGGALTLRYQSVPHGRCGCSVNTDCPGDGRCTDGLCLGGRTCDAGVDCTSGSCSVDGPVVRRGGNAIDEQVTFVLAAGGNS